MGFSVSGATMVILLGMLIAFGMFYTVTDTGITRIVDANQERTERTLEAKNTAITIDRAEYNTSNETLQVDIGNEGTTTLTLTRTSIVIDGDLDDDVALAIASGSVSTDLWLPGETLRVESTTYAEAPDRVKIVTEYGVADRSTIDVLEGGT